MYQGPNLDHVLNRLHQGTARIVIGDIPISFYETDAPAKETINASITSFICPGLTIRYETDSNYKAKVHIAMQEDNEYNDKLLTVNMICDDRQENWWCLYRYMETIQSGQTDGFPSMDVKSHPYGKDGFYRNRLIYIPNIDIVMADLSYQRHQTVRFKRCMPVALSELPINFNSAEQIDFQISFVYSNREVVRELPPSSNIVPPKSVVD